jgi:glycosyltransferase involved in cell wall biosynthesis
MKPKVSIIVPIYNMEAYLDRCLQSLLRQTLTDIEIIAVDDGSTDASLALLRRYAGLDSRVRVLAKRNGGVSAARNDGLRAAAGRYIGFVDPDDWVEPDMYERLYEAAVSGRIDITMCGYVREFGTHAKDKAFPLAHGTTYYGADVQRHMLRRLVGPTEEEAAQPENLDAWGTVWSKLYAAELIERNRLTFTDLNQIGSNEDTLFNLHAFFHANSFQFLDRSYYHYWRGNAASITSSYNPLLPERFEQLYGCMQHFLTEKGLDGVYKSALNNRISMNVIGLGLNIMNAEAEAGLREQLRRVALLLKRELLRQALQRFDASRCAPHWRLFFFLAKSRQATAVYIMLKAMNALRIRSSGRQRRGTGEGAPGRYDYESGRARNDADELLSANGSQQNSV